jgi:hypothetical protein
MAHILSKKGLSKIIIWLTAENILNLIRLDDLADYSEFICLYQNIIPCSELIVREKTLQMLLIN